MRVAGYHSSPAARIRVLDVTGARIRSHTASGTDIPLRQDRRRPLGYRYGACAPIKNDNDGC